MAIIQKIGWFSFVFFLTVWSLQRKASSHRALQWFEEPGSRWSRCSGSFSVAWTRASPDVSRCWVSISGFELFVSGSRTSVMLYPTWIYFLYADWTYPTRWNGIWDDSDTHGLWPFETIMVCNQPYGKCWIVMLSRLLSYVLFNEELGFHFKYKWTSECLYLHTQQSCL